jgi:hypothetical protein
MKKIKTIIKLILAQFIDLIIGLIALIMFIVYIIDDSNNFSGYLILIVGYVSFNIINKVRFNIDPQSWVDQINELKKLK